MDFSNEPIMDVVDVVPNMFQQIVLDSEVTKIAVMKIADIVQIFLNAMFPTVLSLITLAFITYLFRYVITRENTAKSSEYMKGAVRAAVALFLMLNIWMIIRAISWIMELSPTAMYMILILAFILFSAWSLFAIGDAFVALVSGLLKLIVDKFVEVIKKMSEDTPIGRKLNNLRHSELRLIVLVLLVLLFIVSFLFPML